MEVPERVNYLKSLNGGYDQVSRGVVHEILTEGWKPWREYLKTELASKSINCV